MEHSLPAAGCQPEQGSSLSPTLSGDDPKAGLARLFGLGATVTGSQPAGVSWLILADPEGNEFCLEGAAAAIS
jgi:hypothetical protein